MALTPKDLETYEELKAVVRDMEDYGTKKRSVSRAGDRKSRHKAIASAKTSESGLGKRQRHLSHRNLKAISSSSSVAVLSGRYKPEEQLHQVKTRGELSQKPSNIKKLRFSVESLSKTTRRNDTTMQSRTI